ncbi:MAG TPA: sensor histidine kinase [Streptosporangiaceae bacterium]|nr:sensor histidine kinase [Streptosporangiaceae bacterium]
MATRSTEATPAKANSAQANSAQANSVQANDAVLTEARMRGIPGSGSRWRWLFSGIWLAYLIQPISALFDRHDPAWIAGGLILAAAFCAIYLPALMYVDERPRWAGAGLAALAVLSAVACAVYGEHWTPLWIYVSAAGGLILTALFDRRVATLGVVVIAVLYLVSCWITHLDGADTVAVLLPVVLIGLAMMGFRMQLVLMHELAQARETVAKLAANEERLRLARDMHDLTGQSLSMITLKSELAAKRLTRLPASAERDAILTELGDVSRVSRQTLHDIREAVSGYRRPTLAIEVITARSALEAAGVQLDDDPELTMRSGTFDPDAEAVLAWCLREAVTNVIRHSRARHCRLRLAERMGEVSLEVTDDGHGFSGLVEVSSTGSGLRGISERLSAAGGHVSLGQGDNGRGFRLTATVPAATAAAGHNCQP